MYIHQRVNRAAGGSDRLRRPMFDMRSNGTQGARSTMVGPCGPGGLWNLTTLGRAR